MVLVPAALAGQTSQSASTTQAGGSAAVPQLPPRDVSPPGVQIGVGTIRGRVLRADTGEPIVRATLVLSGRAMADGQRSATTNERGLYEFTNLPAGVFSLYALKSGYVTQYFGRRLARNQNSVSFDLAERQVLDAIDLRLLRAGAIEGRVIDQYGEPVQGVQVETMRRRHVAGERRLQGDEGRSAGGATDDLGRFRVYNLAAGPHYLWAARATYTSTVDLRPLAFYPGTLSPAEAEPIVLKAGQEVVGIVLQLGPIRHATVSGRVMSANGGAATLTFVTLSNDLSRRASIQGNTFSVSNVAPGDYVLNAQTDAGEAVFGRVSVGNADVALTLTAATGGTVKGRIVVEGERSTTLRPSNVRLSFTAAAALSGITLRIADDWTFESPGVLGSGLLRTGLGGPGRGGATPAPTFMLKGVFHRGVDVTDTPIDFTAGVTDLEVVLTTRVTTVTGKVTDGRGAVVPDATVVVFSEDRQRWGSPSRFVRAVNADRFGQFTVAGLPPGRYLAAAVDFVEDGDEQDPLVLDDLRRSAVPLTLAEGETKAIDLKLEP